MHLRPDSGESGGNRVELKTAALSEPTSQLPLRVYFSTFTSAIQILPPFCCGFKGDLSCPGTLQVLLSGAPTATKEYFPDINIVMIGEGTPQAVDHWSLVTVRGKQMKSYLLGLEVKNGVCEISLSAPVRQSKKNLFF